MLISIWNQ